MGWTESPPPGAAFGKVTGLPLPGSFGQSSAFSRGSILRVSDPQALGFLKPSPPPPSDPSLGTQLSKKHPSSNLVLSPAGLTSLRAPAGSTFLAPQRERRGALAPLTWPCHEPSVSTDNSAARSPTRPGPQPCLHKMVPSDETSQVVLLGLPSHGLRGERLLLDYPMGRRGSEGLLP